MKKLIELPIAILLLCNMQSVHAQAIRQLELLTGQTINRYQGSSGYGYEDAPPAATVPTMEFYNREYSSFLTEQALKENNRGIKYYNGKKWAKAVRFFDKASKLDPSNSAYSTNLNNARQQLALEKERNKTPTNPYQKTDELFLSNVNKDIEALGNLIKTMRKDLASYVPPPGAPKRVLEDGLMFGLYNSEFEHWLESQRTDNPFSASNKLINPFTRREFKEGEYFAGTGKVTNWELMRGFLDNITIGKYTLSTQHGKELAARLSGTHFKRLIAHSNGATISEALIRENVIKVDELNILGGDRSLMNFSGYDELVKTGKVKKVIVWVNPGDVIPVGSSALPLAGKITDTGRYQSNLTAFFDYKLTGAGNTNPNVEYRFLKGPQFAKGQKMEFSSKAFDAHDLSAYFENMNRYFNLKNTGALQENYR